MVKGREVWVPAYLTETGLSYSLATRQQYISVYQHINTTLMAKGKRVLAYLTRSGGHMQGPDRDQADTLTQPTSISEFYHTYVVFC